MVSLQIEPSAIYTHINYIVGFDTKLLIKSEDSNAGIDIMVIDDSKGDVFCLF